MKKIIALSSVILLSLPLAVYALSIGGAETQGKDKFSLGLDTAFILKRELKFKSASGMTASEEIKAEEIDEGRQITLKTAYGLLENLDAYLKLGAANYKIDAEVYSAGAKTADYNIKPHTDFAYGMGMKGSRRFGNAWFLGCDLQYLRSKHKTKVREDASGTIKEGTYKITSIQEWHIAPYIARKINNLTPYLGVRYSEIRYETKKKPAIFVMDNLKFEADDNFGLFLGTDYKLNKKLTLNLEGRFIDEKAISFGGTYRF